MEFTLKERITILYHFYKEIQNKRKEVPFGAIEFWTCNRLDNALYTLNYYCWVKSKYQKLFDSKMMEDYYTFHKDTTERERIFERLRVLTKFSILFLFNKL